MIIYAHPCAIDTMMRLQPHLITHHALKGVKNPLVVPMSNGKWWRQASLELFADPSKWKWG